MTGKELSKRIRLKALELVYRTKASHIGPILSAADIIAVLYADVMKYRSDEPRWDGRDRLVLSKGHAGLAVYIALSSCGFFLQEMLDTYYSDGSMLSGHVSHLGVPGVEASTGALGHGCGIAAGMALAAKKDGKGHRVFAVLGDGECDEGSVWEMALFSNHYNLENLTVIIDHNKMQSIDLCEKTITLKNLAEKWRAFGWETVEVDGHDHTALKEAMSEQGKSGPKCVIAHTVKGKGVSFMENNILWHYRNPDKETYEKAVREIEAAK